MNEPTDPRFLIVDDSPTMRRVLRALLKEMGFERAEAVADGAAALVALRKSAFDVVITDIMMPNMDGFEFLAAIKADAALRHVPVLVVTAEARQDDNARCIAGGAAGTLVKPYTGAALEAAVRTILQEQAALA